MRMSKPVIVAVDDDPIVLSSLERNLRQKYGRDYRIVKAKSGVAALEVLHKLKQRDEIVALFVVDQRMPEMTGVQFFEEAILIFPEARKVLLTAYSDTQIAIDAINKINIDYHLIRPGILWRSTSIRSSTACWRSGGSTCGCRTRASG